LGDGELFIIKNLHGLFLPITAPGVQTLVIFLLNRCPSLEAKFLTAEVICYCDLCCNNCLKMMYVKRNTSKPPSSHRPSKENKNWPKFEVVSKSTVL